MGYPCVASWVLWSIYIWARWFPVVVHYYNYCDYCEQLDWIFYMKLYMSHTCCCTLLYCGQLDWVFYMKLYMSHTCCCTLLYCGQLDWIFYMKLYMSHTMQRTTIYRRPTSLLYIVGFHLLHVLVYIILQCVFYSAWQCSPFYPCFCGS